MKRKSNRRTNRRSNRRTNRRSNRGTNRRSNRRTNRRSKRRTNRRIKRRKYQRGGSGRDVLERYVAKYAEKKGDDKGNILLKGVGELGEELPPHILRWREERLAKIFENQMRTVFSRTELVTCEIKKIGLNHSSHMTGQQQRLVIKLKEGETGGGVLAELKKDSFAIFFYGAFINANNKGGNALCFKYGDQIILINYKDPQEPGEIEKAKIYSLGQVELKGDEFKFEVKLSCYERENKVFYREQMMKGLFVIDALPADTTPLLKKHLKFVPSQFLLDAAYGKTFLEGRMTFKELQLSLKNLDENLDCNVGTETDEDSFASCNEEFVVLLEADTSKKFSLAKNIILKLQRERIGTSGFQTHGERETQLKKKAYSGDDKYTTESFQISGATADRR